MVMDNVTEDFRFYNRDLKKGEKFQIARFTPPIGCRFDIQRAGIRDGKGIPHAGLRIEIYDHDNNDQLYVTEEPYKFGRKGVNVSNRDIEFRAVNQSDQLVKSASGSITGEMVK